MAASHHVDLSGFLMGPFDRWSDLKRDQQGLMCGGLLAGYRNAEVESEEEETINGKISKGKKYIWVITIT